MKLELNGYSEFLVRIQNHLKQGQGKIINTVTRQKVVTSWQIGKEIDGHLQKNNRAEYGKKLIDQLAQDTAISRSALYQMRSFYQAYPKLPTDNDKLNWSHYQTLSGVKETDKRKYFEELARQKNLNVKTLELEIKKVEGSKKSAKKKVGKKVATVKEVRAKITPQRGKLFSYKVVQLGEEKRNYFDLGFKIFTEVPGKQLQGAKVAEVVKNGEKYSLKKASVNPKQLYTYKAYLERVVDGDTIHVILDLGFKMWHRQILRLAKINAAESDTVEGKKATAALKEILRDVPFLVVKSFSTDIYGRYIADVFFDEKKSKNAEVQKIADEGIYLNQLLLDKGVVDLYL